METGGNFWQRFGGRYSGVRSDAPHLVFWLKRKPKGSCPGSSPAMAWKEGRTDKTWWALHSRCDTHGERNRVVFQERWGRERGPGVPSSSGFRDADLQQPDDTPCHSCRCGRGSCGTSVPMGGRPSAPTREDGPPPNHITRAFWPGRRQMQKTQTYYRGGSTSIRKLASRGYGLQFETCAFCTETAYLSPVQMGGQ